MVDTALTAKVRLRVEGMDCISCATKIENALRRMPGVSDVIVSVPAVWERNLRFRTDSSKDGPKKGAPAIRRPE